MANQDELYIIQSKIDQALNLLKDAVDISIPLLDNEQRGAVIGLWEEFFAEFLSHINKKGQKTGYNLISLISLMRLMQG
ncbi:hypothetical protein SAMN05660649_04626 [Desulfotomaculum arcticum]|uniref:Uncharacterized protein n=1 Tax=Desulfotruncus arcticus DSM 17038 TaxID=1121424 RepID=A0A1I2YV78_9FIRM|nr:hypothetical protein [Desulfotruncus arcticus]SFH29544.1 hypothetical protein SAMN05660649_04626 [Desulfotomaculum arcticum] [Desulfotruncus arcticus DSM 17038]